MSLKQLCLPPGESINGNGERGEFFRWERQGRIYFIYSPVSIERFGVGMRSGIFHMCPSIWHKL